MDIVRSSKVAPRALRTVIAVLAAVGVLASAGCGWMEWPSRPTPRVVKAPPAPSPSPGRAVRGAGGSRFAGAAVVGKGDTVYALSRRHGVSVRAIIDANGLRPPFHLVVGQRVKLPREREHVMKAGETLYGVSRLYGVDTYALARANGIRRPFNVLAGQRLRIPAAAAVAPPAGPAAKKPRKPAAGSWRAAKASKKRPRPVAVPRPPARSRGGFLWPVRGKVVSSFGAKKRGLHNDGINIAAPRGTAVRAAENGVVAYAGNELRGFGNLLLIKHAGGWVTAYAHNQRLLVKRGQRVRRGETIARVGSSGGVTRPQLHFELRRKKRAIDPRKHLRA